VFVAAALTLSAPGARIDGLRDAALSWHVPQPVDLIRGLRLCMDASRRSPLRVKVAREVMRTNPRIDAVDALLLGATVFDAARERKLAPQFLAATLLQESAFNPSALSTAGAVGIAQFTVPTAAEYGVDPWDPDSAIDGAARVLSAYLDEYRANDDPYAWALAAYNAGPGAVAAYRGVPPYRETRDYIIDVRDRWSRMVGR
jgi:soluble lytic murein transglycosylase-like protein